MASNKFRRFLTTIIPGKAFRGWAYTAFCKQNPVDRPVNKKYPEIYNAHGERMRFFYIRDKRMDMYGSYSRHILWDRFNYALENHFYTQKSIMRTIGNPVRKYAWLGESEAITPDDFKLFDQFPGLADEFNLIFTHSARILEKYPNARFAFPTPLWYDQPLSESACDRKTKNISIVSSAKTMCPLHDLRIAIANRCKKEHLADAYGTFDGGPYIPLSKSLQDYRFSIVIENNITPYFFTERITSCFAAMTIPVYLGAPRIGDFFNTDGIIVIPADKPEQWETLLRQCTPQEYAHRLEAVKDNYNRVQDYKSPEDFMWERYLSKEGIE